MQSVLRVPEKGLRRRVAVPMTKYYYPEEYHLERDEPEGESDRENRQ